MGQVVNPGEGMARVQISGMVELENGVTGAFKFAVEMPLTMLDEGITTEEQSEVVGMFLNALDAPVRMDVEVTPHIPTSDLAYTRWLLADG